MGSFCGSSPQTVIQSASNPNVTAQQNQIYGLVNQYANAFGQNPSQLIAPWNPLQTSAAQGVADYSTANQPWAQLGQGMISQGAGTTGAAPGFYGQGASTLGGVNPIGSTAWNPTPYQSPYTQDVINATMANIQQQNQIAQNGALGNMIASGNAFGGDRAGLMMNDLARQQALAANQTMAGLQQANFNQASQQANAQQQYLLNLGLGNNAQLMQQAGLYGQLGGGLGQAGIEMGNLGYQTGNLGNLSQAGTLNALQGLYNMGTGLQGTQQQMLSAPLTFGQWYGNASPGTQAVPTSTTYPGANPLSTIAGLGLTGIAGAGLLSSSGLLGGGAGAGLEGAGLAALAVKEGGRVNKDGGGALSDEDDLAGRFHRMRSALHRAAGGPGGAPMQQQAPPPADPMAIVSNVPHAQDMPTTQAYQRQRMYHLMRGVGNAAAPAQQQAAEQMLATQQVKHGGVIHKDDGGALGGDGSSMASLGSTDNTGIAPAPSLTDLSAQDKKSGAFDKLMKLAHRGADLLTPNTSASSSPTKAPTAPGANNSLASLGSNPMQAMQLANMVNQFRRNNTLDPMGSLGNDSMWVARGGRTIGDLGRVHKQDAGAVGDQSSSDPYDITALSSNQMPPIPSDRQGQLTPSGSSDTRGITPPGGAGGASSGDYSSEMRDLIAEMRANRGNSSLMRNPYMGILAMGFGTLANAGARDAHGVPIPAGAAIGRGGLQGVEFMGQQQKMDLENRRALLEALYHQQMLAQQQYLHTLPQFHPIQNEWGAQTPAVYDPRTGTLSPATMTTSGTGATPASPVPGTSGNYALPTGLDWSKTGQAFLEQLPPQWANTVKAITEGREQYPSINSRDPRAKATLAMVNQVDPSFDATQWRARNQTQAAFASGNEAKNIQALDMLLHHAEKLSQSSEDLGNWNYWGGDLVRHATNPIAGQNPSVGARFKRFQDDADAVAEELSKVFHGGPSVTGVEHWREAAKNTDSSQELRAHTGEAITLAEGRLKGLQDQYERVFGHPPPRPFITPEQQARIDRLKNIGKLGISPQEYDQKYGKVGAPGSATDKGSLTEVQARALPHLTPQNADAEYEKLAPGQKFIDPEGRIRRKPEQPTGGGTP